MIFNHTLLGVIEIVFKVINCSVCGHDESAVKADLTPPTVAERRLLFQSWGTLQAAAGGAK